MLRSVVKRRLTLRSTRPPKGGGAVYLHFARQSLTHEIPTPRRTFGRLPRTLLAHPASGFRFHISPSGAALFRRTDRTTPKCSSLHFAFAHRAVLLRLASSKSVCRLLQFPISKYACLFSVVKFAL